MKKKVQKLSSSPTCLNLPALVLLIAYFLISYGQLQRVQLSNTIAFYGHDLFVILFSVLIFFATKNKKKLLVDLIQRWKYLQYFLIWSLIGLIINQILSGFVLIPWLYLLRLTSYLWFAISIKLSLSVYPCYKELISWLVVIIIGNTLFIGFAQYLLIPDLRFLASAGWDVHYYRMAGNMLDPNFFGMLLIMLLGSWIFILAKTCKQKLAVGLVFISALALTYSRSSYLSFAVFSVIVAVWPQSKLTSSKKINSFLFLCLIILLPFLPRPGGLGVKLGRTETLASRVEVNQLVLSNLSFKQLAIGNGLFTPNINLDIHNRIVHASFPDNILIFLLAGTGILGLGLILKFFQDEIKHAINGNNLIVVLLLSSILVHSMFNLTILEPINLLILLLCLLIADSNKLPNKKVEKTGKITTRSISVKRQGSSVG